ncbi:hypothetical protein SORBI_3001G318432 [Sorghum bicolor]|uniref:No apical meristem-associated C-terminal domain-containing protein n=1 Tax=Sorghum bicolor TaxID=4558 RepID=A0A1Z5S8K0_SORBI|nr:hypothetical protein SORBI_3001G318432 [Sorghum bicolor]
MSRKSKRTSAPTPMEIPPPVAQSGQPAPPPSIPSMFGPGVWCPPRPPQSMPPSSAPCWLTGVQQPGMASSSAQGPWWAPPGAGASAYPWSGPNNLEESDVQEWGLDSHPPGGFLNILKSTPQAASNGSSSQAIHIDVDNNTRTEKRLTWTKKEDLRLVAAWVNNSNDPVQANYKKNDQYWKGVADVFNSTTPKDRVRTAKQIKDHFGRIKKRVACFCGNWKEANAMWASGESDEDVMNRALESYAEDHKKDGPFMFRHCWEVLSKEPKWDAYLERLEDLEPGKRKFQHCIIDLEDELNNFLDAQKAANEGRAEMLETQRRVSSEKLESRRLAHLAAKEHKEAVMLETYRSLLMQNFLK